MPVTSIFAYIKAPFWQRKEGRKESHMFVRLLVRVSFAANNNFAVSPQHAAIAA